MTRFGVDRNTENLRYHYVAGNTIGGIVNDFAPNDVLNYDSSVGSYLVIGPSEKQYGLLIETVGDRRQAQTATGSSSMTVLMQGAMVLKVTKVKRWSWSGYFSCAARVDCMVSLAPVRAWW